MIGPTAGTTGCVSHTCSCDDCSVAYSGTAFCYIVDTTIYREPFEYCWPSAENLFHSRYWDRSEVNRFEVKSQTIRHVFNPVREKPSIRWVAKSRNSKSKRRKIRVFER